MLATGVLAGGLLSSCGTENMGGTSAPVDPVAASMRTHQEFENYWGPRRTVEPVEVAQVEEPAPAPVAPAPVEPAVESYAVEESYEVEDSSADWVVMEEPLDGPKPSRKNALPVTTWWEYQGDTGRGARDYTNLGGGGYPTGKSVWGSRKYVRSPYHGGYVDVGNVPSGALVADPSYDVAERKFFILP